MTKQLKLYTASIEDTQDGVLALSFVKEPAHGGLLKVLEEDDEAVTIAAPIIIANKLIYRNNKQMGEHNIIFLPDDIKSFVEKAVTDKATYSFDVEHSGNHIDGVALTQSFIIDYKAGITTYNGLCGLNEGSWIGIFKITNDELREAVKAEDVRGISVSMYASYEEVTLKDAIDMYNFLKVK